METAPILTIDFKNFTLGESKSARIADRGFSPESYGVNFYAEQGTMYFAGGDTDLSTNLEDNPICFATDPDYLGQDAYVVGDAGKFYTLDGTTLTKRQTDSGRTYQIGASDAVKFLGDLYVTSKTDIAKLTGSTLSSIDATWWSATRAHGVLQSSYRHPLEVVEDTLYIGDKNELHTWDGTTSVDAALTLPYYINIISLRKHPDGRHLIAFCGVTANYSHVRNGGGKIYIIDTVNLEWVREIDIESQIEGSRNVGGVVYVTYGDKLGYFNGDGIAWVRDLAAGSVTYSHQMSNAEDTLLIRDGQDVLAYGDLGQGKVWWRPYRTQAASGTVFTALGYKGADTILTGYQNGSAVSKLYSVELNTAGLGGVFYSNHYQLGSHVAIRRIEIDHTLTPASGTHAMFLQVKDMSGTVLYSGTISYTNDPKQTSRVDLDAFAYDVQIQIYPTNGSMGFRQIRIYGESIE